MNVRMCWLREWLIVVDIGHNVIADYMIVVSVSELRVLSLSLALSDSWLVVE